MWRVVNPTREHEVLELQPRLLDPLLHGLAGRRRDLNLHRALGLVLHYHGAYCHLVAVADVPELEADKVLSSECALGQLPWPRPIGLSYRAKRNCSFRRDDSLNTIPSTWAEECPNADTKERLGRHDRI
jgi:hypothetical protein